MPGVNEVHSYYNPALLQQQPHYINYQLLDTSQMESMEQNYLIGSGTHLEALLAVTLRVRAVDIIREDPEEDK